MQILLYIIDGFIIAALLVGLLAGCLNFYDLNKHASALKKLAKALSFGSIEQKRDILKAQFLSAYALSAPADGEDEILAERVAYLHSAAEAGRGGRRLFTHAEMSTLAYSHFAGLFSIMILRQLAALLLIMGICGTLWEVSAILTQHATTNTPDIKELAHALWHSMLAIPFTVILTGFYEFNKARQTDYLMKLDLLTAHTLHPLLPSAKEKTRQERLTEALTAVTLDGLDHFETDVRLMLNGLEQLPQSLVQLTQALHQRQEQQQAFSRFLQDSTGVIDKHITAGKEYQETLHIAGAVESSTAESLAKLTFPQEPPPRTKKETGLPLNSLQAQLAQLDTLGAAMPRKLLPDGALTATALRQATAARRRRTSAFLQTPQQIARHLTQQQNNLRAAAEVTDATLRQFTAAHQRQQA